MKPDQQERLTTRQKEVVECLQIEGVLAQAACQLGSTIGSLQTIMSSICKRLSKPAKLNKPSFKRPGIHLASLEEK